MKDYQIYTTTGTYLIQAENISKAIDILLESYGIEEDKIVILSTN